ncbi:serine-rich adhesin for platelets-like [Haliotis asinina]|uniref:serine-rich adhesin for platelets-like n=1 Tax=Haliotis asinina TaxID=109174 RepID=UPI00353278EE
MLPVNLAISLIGLVLPTASGSVAPSRAVVYHHGETSMSWEHAASFCEYRGWRLAQLNNDYDLTPLKHLFPSNDIVWIGLASTEVGRTTYHWTDCKPYGDHQRAPWDSDEPNFLDSQLCVMMKGFKFKTNYCSKEFKILCEEIQDAETCVFQAVNPQVLSSGSIVRSPPVTMSAESDCQKACLEYQDEKQCIAYYYESEVCELYLGELLIFSNSTAVHSPLSIKVCHSYQTIIDSTMESWDEPFVLSCEEGLADRSKSNEFTDTAHSATNHGLTSSLFSSSVTMVTTTGIHPTSYHLQSSMMNTDVDRMISQTAALPSSAIQEKTNDPPQGVTSTDIIKDTFSLSGHTQRKTDKTGQTEGSVSEESYSSDALLMSTTTGTMDGATTGSAEVPPSESSYSTDILQVSSTTLIATGSTEGPQSPASYSTDILHVSSTTLADHVRATTSRMVSTTCVCPCVNLESRAASHSELIKELIVKKTTLSSFKRKKTSAKDERPSAQAIGNIGVVLLAVTGVFILVLDADVIARLISGLFKPC